MFFSQLCGKYVQDYLAQQLEGVKVPVHVATQPALDWLGKNFRYEEMQADELVRRAAAGEPGLYLRAVSRTQPRTRPTQLQVMGHRGRGR